MESKLFDKQMKNIAQINLPHVEIDLDYKEIIIEALQQNNISICFIRIAKVSAVAAGIVLMLIIYLANDLSNKSIDHYESFNKIFATLNYNLKETDLP